MMKKIIQLIFLSFIIVLVACNKDDINNTENKVGISRVTNFPLLSLNGERYVTITVGGAYTEAGAVATEAGADIPVTTSGSVNTAIPGVYTLTYSAVNKDGFSASVTRTVVIYSTDASAAANDLSGNYARTSNGSVSTWTKLAPGVYKVFNPGGAPGTNVTVIAINPTGFTIKIPVQPIGDGTPMSSSDELYTNSVPATYSWKIVNQGYGTALRTFIKQ
jgi:hypothetical protein